jgi:hypothetical protein
MKMKYFSLKCSHSSLMLCMCSNGMYKYACWLTIDYNLQYFIGNFYTLNYYHFSSYYEHDFMTIQTPYRYF